MLHILNDNVKSVNVLLMYISIESKIEEVG